jgi:hypothetical protein
VQAWLQPRYGLTVQLNGIAEPPGTLFSAERASTSWNTMPANSGVCTDRNSPAMPGSTDALPIPSCATR